jgi:hypothetical protein
MDPAAAFATAAIPPLNAFVSGVNGTYVSAGTLPADRHITLAALGLPSAFGAFSNLAHNPGTWSLTFALTVDAVPVASKKGTYVIP